MLDLIATGCGRSGTGWFSQVLTEAGVACGHEEVFGPHGMNVEADVRADSSWMAVPSLRSFPETPVLLLFRDPSKVIASFLGIKFFETPSPYRDFVCALHPEMIEMGSFEACCHYYVVWNRRAMMHATMYANIERFRWDQIIGRIPGLTTGALAAAIPKVPTDYNHRPRSEVDSDLIPISVWDTFHEMERRSGY